MRRLLLLVVAAVALWLAPGALAAGWCGTGETIADRPDATTGQQIHPLIILPADATDDFFAAANKLQDDVDSVIAWWTGQDPTRAPRFDQAVFPTGTCLDISFLRLTDTTADLRGATTAFFRVERALESAGFANEFKKYYVYYDGPSVQQDICGTGQGEFAVGPAFALVWLQGCPGINDDAVGAHELLHALGALPRGAPHACPGDPGHPCDSPQDVLYPTADPARPLQLQLLDVGHDDYYAHAGGWNDLQDSLWLRHLDAGQLPVSVTMSGTGTVTSREPGIACGAPCTTQWDQGAFVTLTAKPGARERFVRWSGACVGTSDCALQVSAAESVTAVFGPSRVRFTASTRGSGTVRCTPACSTTIAAGKALTLRAVPTKGWRFVSWSGACKGANPLCRPATAAAVSVRATFRRK
ncbi:MAG: InlB B-repeat-containing protein [Gaiellaceae bacterium]